MKQTHRLRWTSILMLLSVLCTAVLLLGSSTVARAAVPGTHDLKQSPFTDNGAGSPNLLSNAGFESGTDAWYDFGGNPQTTTSTAHSGAASLQMGTGQQGRAQNVTLQPGTIYTLSGWGRTSGGGEFSQITLRVVDGAGNSTDYQMAFYGTNWTRQARVIQTPATVSSALIYTLKNNGSGYFYADDIYLGAGRDPEIWPFAKDSIWNSPIGSSASYTATAFSTVGYIGPDPTFISSSDLSGSLSSYALYSPDGPSYTSGGYTYGGRCTGTTLYGPLQFPPDLVVQDSVLAPYYSTPNDLSATLQSDNRTIEQLQPTARCTAHSDVNGYRATEQDLYGPGTYGSHFGSGLSGIGGAVRPGELTNPMPIMHALQLELWGRKYLAYNAASSTPGFRWPAVNADGYASGTDGYCSLDPCKSKPNPSLVQGALLAIPPSVTESSLGLTTTAGHKLFQAMQNYGGYIVDDTGQDTYGLGVDANAQYDINFQDASFVADFNALFTRLQVVDNNSPASIGGGGIPRAPLAPDFTVTAPPDLAALDRTGWTASASLNSSSAQAMLDGNATTGWRSGQAVAADQYIQIDMQKVQTFNRIDMDSGAYPFDHPQNYAISVSNDGTNWSPQLISGVGSRDTIMTFPTQTARYLRVTSVSGGFPGQSWSVDEFNVYNNTGFVYPAYDRTGWSVSASASCCGDVPAHAIDGDPGTRWTTGQLQANGQIFQIDMGSARDVSKIVLDATNSPNDYPRGYIVFVSNSSGTWGNAVTACNLCNSSAVQTITFPTQTARYITILETQSAGTWWSIDELNVYP